MGSKNKALFNGRFERRIEYLSTAYDAKDFLSVRLDRLKEKSKRYRKL